MPRIKADTIAEHRENQRARLLEAARHILITDGAVAVTPGAVAQAAGISRPAVYQYFENGTALIEHVVLDDFEDSLEAIEAAVDAAADPHTRALAYVENVIRQAASGMHLTATALSGYTMPDTFNREIAELHKKQIGPFVGALRELGITDHIEFALLGGIVETGVKLAESNVPVEPIIDGICRQLDAALARHRNADHHD